MIRYWIVEIFMIRRSKQFLIRKRFLWFTNFSTKNFLRWSENASLLHLPILGGWWLCFIICFYQDLVFGGFANLPHKHNYWSVPYYTGSFNVKLGEKVQKMYLLVFTCLNVRAMYLELLPDMTCEQLKKISFIPHWYLSYCIRI